MSKFTKSLEEKAEFLASVPKREQWNKSIPSIVRREIALTVDQIKRLKEKHEEQFRGLLRIECYVDTDLMRLEERIPRYAPYHFPEKEKFKQRLFDIEKERRNLKFFDKDILYNQLHQKNKALLLLLSICRKP